MTTQEETHYIQQVLPLMASRSSGLYLGEEDVAIPKQGITAGDYLSLARRLVSEGLATTSGAVLFLAITSKGKQIAEQPGGYLGYLAAEAKRRKTEESRSWLSANGTWIGGIATLLTLLYTIYSTQQNSVSLDQLNAKLQTQAARLRALETMLQQRQRP